MGKIPDKFLVVDVVFKNGKGLMKDCAIFKKNDKGESSVQNKELIKELLDNGSNGFICLQNSCANITTHHSNISSYNIKEIDGEEF